MENSRSLVRSHRLVRLTAALVGILALSAAGCASAQEAKEVTAQGRDAILSELPTPAAGAAHPSVTIVEFFDYNCPFCRREQPILQTLLKSNPKVRLVYKEWPVLGSMSLAASRAALAANWQGKYLAAHNALIATPARIASADQIATALAAAGVDTKRLAQDEKTHAGEIDAVLKRDNEEAEKLGLEGTPGLMVGRFLVFGGLDPKSLAAMMKAASAHP